MPAPMRRASSHMPSTSASTCAAGVSPGAPKATTNAVGRAAHRLDVGGVLGDRLAADVVRRRPVQPEVPVLHEHVGRHQRRGRRRPTPPPRRHPGPSTHRGGLLAARAPAGRSPRTHRVAAASGTRRDSSRTPPPSARHGPVRARSRPVPARGADRASVRTSRPCGPYSAREMTIGTRANAGDSGQQIRRCAGGARPNRTPMPRTAARADDRRGRAGRRGDRRRSWSSRRSARRRRSRSPFPAVPAPQADSAACRALMGGAAAAARATTSARRSRNRHPRGAAAWRSRRRTASRWCCAADSTARPISWWDPRSRSSTGCSGSRCGRRSPTVSGQIHLVRGGPRRCTWR